MSILMATEHASEESTRVHTRACRHPSPCSTASVEKSAASNFSVIEVLVLSIKIGVIMKNYNI